MHKVSPLFLKATHTHTHTRARAHTHTRTHTHTHNNKKHCNTMKNKKYHCMSSSKIYVIKAY